MKTLQIVDLDTKLSIPGIVAQLGVDEALEWLYQDVLKVPRGSVWLIHLPLPHYPYALTKDCDIRPLPWLRAQEHFDDEAVSYEANTEETRREKYPLYLEQVECTHKMLAQFFSELKKSGIYDSANIVVYGDHGARIALHNLRSRPSYRSDFQPSPRTIVDYLGTFFAYKPAGRSTGQYRREMVDVADLLREVSLGNCCKDVADEADPTGYLVEWDAEVCDANRFEATAGCRLIPIQIPRFTHGKLQERAKPPR